MRVSQLPVPLTLALSLAWSGVLPGVAGAADVTLRLLDGSTVEVGSLSMTDPGVLEVRTGADGAPREVPIDSVLAAVVTTDEPHPVVRDDTSLLLVDGSRLVGELLDAEEDEIRVRSGSLGEVIVPIDVVRAVSFGPVAARLDPESLLGEESEDDVVYRRGPVEGDQVAGVVTSVGASGVSIDAELGALTLGLDDVLGAAIAVIDEDWPAPTRRVEVELRDGGLLIGDLVELSSGRLTAAVAWNEALAVPLDRVAALRFGSARFVWLSDVEPAAVMETPYLGGSDDFLFGWRRDRTVTGRALIVGGERFGKGLGLHSRAKLTWALDGAYTRLDAQAGVADEVLEHGITGSIVVRFLVDGEVRFESDVLVAGKPAAPVSIDLSGAARLELEVDFADRGDVGDRAVIGDPVLILGN